MNAKTGMVCLLLAVITTPTAGMAQQQVRWEPTLESAQRLAEQTNRLVIVQFWAPWCTVCTRMEAEVLSRPEVVAALHENYVPVKINADHFPATARQYGITALPTTIITAPDGQLLDKVRGRLGTAQYLERINRVAAEAAKRREAQAALTASASAQPAYVAPSTNAPNYNASQPAPAYGGPIAAPTQPQQNSPAIAGAQQPQYNPPVGYMPPQDPTLPQNNQQPPMVADATAPAGAQPSQYANPPVAYGQPSQQPQQAPTSPAYGAPAQPAYQKQPTTGYIAQQPAQSQPSQNYASQPPVQNPPMTNYAAQQPMQNASVGSYPVQPPVQNQPATNYAAQQPVQNQPSQPSQNPPAVAGGAPLCLDGFCPVTLCEKQSWTPGDVRWGAIHRGRTYLFVGPEEQRRFFADPDRYAPVGSGNDIVLAAEQGRAVPGARQHGVFYENRVYLFASEESLLKFAERPEVYANQVLNATRSCVDGRHLQ